MPNETRGDNGYKTFSPSEYLKKYYESWVSFSPKTQPKEIEDELAKRENLKNQDFEQDIKLKKITLMVLLGFLAVETLLVFYFSFLQATKIWNFQLEKWSFDLLIGATITQIYYMLKVAVEYLFPKKGNK